MLVLEGVLQDAHGVYPAGTWQRSPQLTARRCYSENGCLVWIKTGHLPLLPPPAR
jgi:anti-sigma factor ChrR (cupin superfamily)